MSTVITIDGTAYDAAGRAGIRVRPEEAAFAAMSGYPTFRFRAYSRTLAPGALPWEGKAVTVSWDGQLVFAGRVEHVECTKTDNRKYDFIYHCVGLKALGDRIPVRDRMTGSDRCTFNHRTNDPQFLPSRAGRSVGQMLLEVLEMPAHAAGLAAQGVGNFVPGDGARLKAQMAGGVVSAATLLAGGTGYSAASPPSVCFSGGSPTTVAAGTASITGGALTGISWTSHGSGYQYAPAIVVSRLPLVTVRDLLALDIVPPTPLTVQGERLLDAIEAQIKQVYPTHFLWVEPDGTIRVWDEVDIRDKGTRVKVTGTTGVGCLAYAVVNPLTGAVTAIRVVDGGRFYAGTITATVEGTGTGCVLGTPSVEGGAIKSIGVQAGGTGYSEHRHVVLTHGINHLTAPEVTRDSEPCYSRVEVVSAPLATPMELAYVRGDIAEKYDHDGLDTATAKLAWTYNDFDQVSSQSGQATASSLLLPGPVDTTWSHVSDQGHDGTAGTYDLAIGGGGGTGAAGRYVVGTNGKLSGVTLTAGGTGYTSTPALSFPYGGIVGAKAECRLTPRGVDKLTLSSGGRDYASTPLVYVYPPDSPGSPATFTATVAGGVVTTLTKTAAGSGYRVAPKVRIQGPYSSGTTVCYGTCTCPSTTTVTITPDDPVLSWAPDTWSWVEGGRRGVILLSASLAEGIDSRVVARVISDPGLPPGGTCSLTLDTVLPVTTYTSFTLRGTGAGGALVYRRFHVTSDAIGSRMTTESFAVPLPHSTSGGVALQNITQNTGFLLWSSDHEPPYIESYAYFDVDPDAGDIIFQYPVLEAYTPVDWLRRRSYADTWVFPDDIRVIVGVYRDPLRVASPADVDGVPQHAGTLHSDLGIHRTLQLCHPDWRDASQTSMVRKMADKHLEAVKDVIIEANFNLNIPAPFLFRPGTALVVAAWTGGTTGSPGFGTGTEDTGTGEGGGGGGGGGGGSPAPWLVVKSAPLKWPHEGAYTWQHRVSASNRLAVLSSPVALPPARAGLNVSAGSLPMPWSWFAPNMGPGGPWMGQHPQQPPDHQEEG